MNDPVKIEREVLVALIDLCRDFRAITGEIYPDEERALQEAAMVANGS